MRNSLHRDRRATVALEFAILAPATVGLFLGVVAFCLAIWTLTVLQATAEQAARCAAISSSACATVTAGCGSSTAVICYVETRAAALGVASVTASEVDVSTTTLGGVRFNTVAIAHAYTLFTYHMTLKATGMYPTNVTAWGSSPPSS